MQSTHTYEIIDACHSHIIQSTWFLGQCVQSVDDEKPHFYWFSRWKFAIENLLKLTNSGPLFLLARKQLAEQTNDQGPIRDDEWQTMGICMIENNLFIVLAIKCY